MHDSVTTLRSIWLVYGLGTLLKHPYDPSDHEQATVSPDRDER